MVFKTGMNREGGRSAIVAQFLGKSPFRLRSPLPSSGQKETGASIIGNRSLTRFLTPSPDFYSRGAAESAEVGGLDSLRELSVRCVSSCLSLFVARGRPQDSTSSPSPESPASQISHGPDRPSARRSALASLPFARLACPAPESAHQSWPANPARIAHNRLRDGCFP